MYFLSLTGGIPRAIVMSRLAYLARTLSADGFPFPFASRIYAISSVLPQQHRAILPSRSEALTERNPISAAATESRAKSGESGPPLLSPFSFSRLTAAVFNNLVPFTKKNDYHRDSNPLRPFASNGQIGSRPQVRAGPHVAPRAGVWGIQVASELERELSKDSIR